MARNAFDQITRIVDDRLNRTPALVSNLHGTIEEKKVVAGAQTQQSWFALSVDAKKMPTFREFVDALSFQRTPVGDVNGTNGTTRFPETGAVKQGTAVMLFSAVNCSGPTSVPIEVVATGQDIAIYNGEIIAASGTGRVTADLRFTGGLHYVAVIAFGSTSPLTVTVPSDTSLLKSEPAPAPPVLAGQPQVGYLKAENGSYIVDVTWHNDATASAWQVYRCGSAKVGEITKVTDLGAGAFEVTFKTQVQDLRTGEWFFTSKFFGGTITKITLSNDAEGEPQTTVQLALDAAATTESKFWLGSSYLRPTGAYQSVSRVTYSGEPTITFSDTSIREAQVYLYKVTAFGVISGTSESDYSQPGYAVINDIFPPGDISFDPNEDVRIVNGELFLDFTAPSDDDYSGVKLYVEDPAQNFAQVLLTTEFGVKGERDQLSARLPFAAKYYFRTFDTAGNIQTPDEGVMWEWDGKSNWSRAIVGTLQLVPIEGENAVDVRLAVEGMDELFPATVRFFVQQLDTPLVLNDGGTPDAPDDDVTQYILTGKGAIDKNTAPGLPGLAGVPLSSAGQTSFWAEITDIDGNITYAFNVADLGASAGGMVVPEDYLPFPNFTLIFDEDVIKIEIEVPDGDGGVLGVVTFTREASGGLPPSGGGEIIYDVGDLVVKKADGTLVRELALPVEGTRGPYKVTYYADAGSEVMWKGNLHGPTANAPALATRLVVETTLLAAVDLFVTPTSPALSKERLTIQVKDEDDPSLPIWRLVVGQNDGTARYVDSGTEVGPESWFHMDPDLRENGDGTTTDGPLEPGVWAKKLDNIPLVAGQVKRYAVRAIGEDSKVPTPWILVPMPFKEVPVIDSADLTFSEADDKLYFTVVAGEFTRSTRVEIADNETFAAPRLVSDTTLQDNDPPRKFEVALTDADRNKRWFARATGYNKALENGVVQGLGGRPKIASVDVGEPLVEGPTGTVDLIAVTINVSSGELRAIISPTNNTKSFTYKLALPNNAPDLNPVGRSGPLNFVPGVPYILTGLGTIGVQQRQWITVWFHSDVNGGGDEGAAVTDDLLYVPAGPPEIVDVTQTRNVADTSDLYVDFNVIITDPINRGGTLRVYTNKSGRASASTSQADGAYLIAATPATVTSAMADANGNFPLQKVLGNASEDKFVVFEFENIHGQKATARVKVTTKLVDVDEKGKLTPGAVTLNTLASNIHTGTRVTSLPATGNPGDMVVYNGTVYYFFGGAWKDSTQLTSYLGQLPGGRIQAGTITAGLLNIGIISSISSNLGTIVQGFLRGFNNADNYINLEAVGSQHFINSAGFYIDASGNAFFNGNLGSLTVQAIKGSFSTLSALSTKLGIGIEGTLVGYNSGVVLNLDAGKDASNPYNAYYFYSPNFKIFANGAAEFTGSITITKSSVQSAMAGQPLSDFTGDLGTLFAGMISNGGNWLDLRSGTPSGYVLNTPALKLSASEFGTNTFSGNLQIWGNGQRRINFADSSSGSSFAAIYGLSGFNTGEILLEAFSTRLRVLGGFSSFNQRVTVENADLQVSSTNSLLIGSWAIKQNNSNGDLEFWYNGSFKGRLTAAQGNWQ